MASAKIDHPREIKIPSQQLKSDHEDEEHFLSNEHRQTLALVNLNSYRCGTKTLRKRAISASMAVRPGPVPPKRSRKKSDIVRPTKFLLGGNINDPLNLHSLQDEETNRQMNAVTPKSSPMPTPQHRKGEIEVVIPANITDPLNLKGDEDGKKKKNKNKKKKRNSSETVPTDELLTITIPTEEELAELDKTVINTNTPKEEKLLNVTKRDRRLSEKDKIVSPVVKQPGQIRHKRPSGFSNYQRSISKEGKPEPSAEIVPPIVPPPQPKTPPITKHKNVFQFGNYNQYYGYRNQQNSRDLRLDYFQKDWFAGKEVLDIGCNIGHITYTIARDFEPKCIRGIDIDGSLIKIAQKNLKHYMVRNSDGTSSFPTSMPHMFGSLLTPFQTEKAAGERFPNNVNFVKGNYVPDCDELLDLVPCEYDVIVCLSVTKWVHLNWGDEGIKRMFKKMFKHLRPGGKLVLEVQPWSSYKKKKKLTDKIYEVYRSIKFYPSHFSQYLLSGEVGFMRCETISTPEHTSRGFQRPIQIFKKGVEAETQCEGPSTEQVTATTSEVTPTRSEVTANTSEVTPTRSEVTANTSEVMPTTSEVTPTTSEVMPSSTSDNVQNDLEVSSNEVSTTT